MELRLSNHVERDASKYSRRGAREEGRGREGLPHFTAPS